MKSDPSQPSVWSPTAAPDLRPPSRRDFLKTCGAGLLVWVLVRPSLSAEESEASHKIRKRPSLPKDFNAFLSIHADGRVTCFTGKIEMGQGTCTVLPQLLAEELDVPLDQVELVMGDTELCPFDEGTWGSLTTRRFGPAFRAAAAEARAVLLTLGAEKLKHPVADLITRQGRVELRDNPQISVSYGELTQGKRIERRVEVTPDLKKPSQFKIIGKPHLRRDSREKVTGKALYAGDIRLPGMLYACVLRAPAQDSKLLELDASAVAEIPGARCVQLPGLVAVLHACPDLAAEALAKLQPRFSASTSTLDDRSIFEHLAKVTVPARTITEKGDLSSARPRAATRHKASYLNAYVAHAALETHTALARVEENSATLWVSTQNPFGVRDEIAQVLKLELEQVRVITPYLGGGFGGKAFNLQAVEAARLSKAVGAPVQVAWSREEEFFNDTFRPAAVVNVDAGLDDQGRLSFFDYEVRFAGDRGSELLYDVPNRRITAVGNYDGPEGIHPFRIGAWRGPGCNTNAFARESHIDQMAVLAACDPIEFRLRHLSNPRLLRVLKAAAELWNWSPQKGPSGKGLGVACGFDAGTYVASIAEIKVDPASGHIQVTRVLCVQEMGLVVNPAGARLQMEGCIMMGLGYSLTEEVRFNKGELKDTNFDSYELPRFSWVPRIETHILDQPDQPPQGGGEPAVIVMGAVIANALHDACGVRLLELPLTPARVKAALTGKSAVSVS